MYVLLMCFREYATVLLLAFLFLSIVMLMNILIAQLSDTYESMKKDAVTEVDMNRAWITAVVELQLNVYGVSIKIRRLIWGLRHCC